MKSIKVKERKVDVLIVGTGASGLYCALHLPDCFKICIISKSDLESSDSFLAQGGMCVLKEASDYRDYFEDTLRAGHYENNKEAVRLMIEGSRDVAKELIDYGVEFERKNGQLIFTREGAHSKARILYHQDTTGKEITSKLLMAAKGKDNISILDRTSLLDILVDKNQCYGGVIEDHNKQLELVKARYTVFATGGIGGLYEHSTNYRHLTGDALSICLDHQIEMENLDYVQIHPTSLYTKQAGRHFLISESVRGEGAFLYNKAGQRFVDELLPRDLLTKHIYEEMEKDETEHVWLSMTHLPKSIIDAHFPAIRNRCLEEGYDIYKEWIPVVPAQHYFMGGIHVDMDSRTSVNHLYAVGETSCNGVHGANRLASNSLLEGFVFAKRAVKHISELGKCEKKYSNEWIQRPQNIDWASMYYEEWLKLMSNDVQKQRQQELKKMIQKEKNHEDRSSDHVFVYRSDNTSSSQGRYK